MSIFSVGSNKVARRVVIRNITEAMAFDIPAGAVVTLIQARNKSETATNISVGNAAAGTQFSTATAVPVATDDADISTAGLLYKVATLVQPSKVASNVHVTLSAYPANGVDVAIEYVELLDSLAQPSQGYPVAY
jgi:hypothetical protein